VMAIFCFFASGSLPLFGSVQSVTASNPCPQR
jgi:hypothetical protein